MSEWTPILLAFLAAIPGLFALRSNKKKIDAEARTIEVEITERVMKLAHAEIDKMQKHLVLADTAREKLSTRLKVLEDEIEQYKLGTGMLMAQLIERGERPRWTPPGMKNMDRHDAK